MSAWTNLGIRRACCDGCASRDVATSRASTPDSGRESKYLRRIPASSSPVRKDTLCRVDEIRFAGYFERDVLPKRPYLRRVWCLQVVRDPVRVEQQPDGRWRFWGIVPELGGRYLRVVTLPDRVTILNAFPDRRFRP